MKRIVLLSLLCGLTAVSALPPLEAGGWGKGNEQVLYEDADWNSIYFDMNGLYFTALVPNYDGTSMSNGSVEFRGHVDDTAGYVIKTSMNPNFTPPKSANAFLKMIQEANPQFQASLVEPKGLGAKYVVDIVPIDPEVTAYWRFISTKDRLLSMGTDDQDALRRTYFFESILIRK